VRPGTRVRVTIDHVFSDGSVYHGEEGVVVESCGSLASVVDVGPGVSAEIFWNKDLAVISSRPIDVGDRVRVRLFLGSDAHLDGYLGKCGVVVRWTSDDPEWDGEDWSNERIVKFDDGQERCVLWEEMEHVELTGERKQAKVPT